MNVVHFQETTGRDREDDIDTTRRHRRTFQSLTDSAEGGPEQVLAFADVPAIGDVLEYTDDIGDQTDDTLVVVRRRAEQNDKENLCNWTVTVEYLGSEDPEAQPAEVEFGPTRYQEHMIDDLSDPPVPVVNAAGDPLTEGVVRDRTRFTITITKNIADEDWDPVAAEGYQDSLNANPFLLGYYTASPDGFLPGTCKLTLGAKRMRKKGLNTFYWARTATIDVDSKGWNAKVRNAGFRYYDADANELRRVLDKTTGHPSSIPLLLAEGGGLLPSYLYSGSTP